MSHQLKREYLITIRKRYLESSHSKKSLILDEFCEVCDYARKYAIAILNGHIEPAGPRPRGRQVRYGLDVVYHMVRLWNAMGRPGSTKFRAAIPGTKRDPTPLMKWTLPGSLRRQRAPD